jgi:hypothetical protein
MNRRKIAAYLMLFSGIAHVAQLFILGTENQQNVNGSLFGSTFLLVGALLLTQWRMGLWVGAIWPLLLGFGATYRIVALDPNPQTYLFTLIDYVVVVLCATELMKSK